MCCLLTFHGGIGRLPHCCIKKGKRLYQKSDVKKSEFCNNLHALRVGSADSGTNDMGRVFGRFFFFLLVLQSLQ